MTHFLVSEDKPDGHKLEDILTAIRRDIIKRCGNISEDTRVEAQQVLRNNIKILEHLSQSIQLAEDSTQILDRSFGPSKAGNPRIGE